MIDEEASRLHRPERAFLAQGHLREVIVIPDAADDDVGVFRCLGWRNRYGAAIGLRPFLRLADRSVIDGQLVPGLRQMPCHRAAHDAQADKRDISHMPRTVSRVAFCHRTRFRQGPVPSEVNFR